MTIGSFVRGLLGGRERQVAALYRRVFVDLSSTTRKIETSIPQGAKVVDIGGGDGEALNFLLAARPDLTVIMLDPSPRAGVYLNACFQSRVRIVEATSLEQYAADFSDAGAVLVSDVVHHVPKDRRIAFLRKAASLLATDGVLIVKEFAPGGVVSRLGLWSDHYISGEHQVEFMRPDELRALVSNSTGMSGGDELLGPAEHPNYAIAFRTAMKPSLG